MARVKFIAGAVVLTLIATGAYSQNATKKSAESALEISSVSYSLPRTAVVVDIVQEKEVIKKGPYARFAQKYLGVVAPLSDKEIYKIKSAVISAQAEADPSETYILDNPDRGPAGLLMPTYEGFTQPYVQTGINKPVNDYNSGIFPISNVGSDTYFGLAGMDKTSSVELSLEDMAAAAAEKLFTLRNRRFDLVSGEAGENVYGAGMEAALEEMRRLEEEYLALFVGKSYKEVTVRQFTVIPVAGTPNLIVCRFSENAGLLSDSDLTGRPITLEMSAEGKAKALTVPRKTGKDSRGTIYYRVPDAVKCSLKDGNTLLAADRIPIYQFGETVEIPVSAIK